MTDERDPSSPATGASWASGATGAWAVLVHGGAGTLVPERAGAHVAGCRAAAARAAEALGAGASALDAVVLAVAAMEDAPCFNAGTGACLNRDGLIELDAAVMEGSALRAGAVCALPPFAHPIAIARAVLDDGDHVLLAGEGAAQFAIERGFSRSTSEALTTDAARADWRAWQARLRAATSDATGGGTPAGGTPAGGTPAGGTPAGGIPAGGIPAGGTVGAVARDARGTVAAATSTGGRVGKRPGRVGDSPLLGAGTYADDAKGACSATGLGEAILRITMARAACDAMRDGAHPEQVARDVMATLKERVGGAGGVILVDRLGRLGLAHNTPSMAWAAFGAEIAEAFGT